MDDTRVLNLDLVKNEAWLYNWQWTKPTAACATDTHKKLNCYRLLPIYQLRALIGYLVLDISSANCVHQEILHKCIQGRLGVASCNTTPVFSRMCSWYFAWSANKRGGGGDPPSQSTRNESQQLVGFSVAEPYNQGFLCIVMLSTRAFHNTNINFIYNWYTRLKI